MDIITIQQLRDLVEAGTPPCVSIFMPTHSRHGRDVRQDPAHLKNLLREAEEKLVRTGMRPTLARDLLEPARKLQDDPDFWLRNEGALAIYLAEGFFRIFTLPVSVEDAVMVNARFEIKPLLPLLHGKLFYVLALAQKGVRLLECTRHSCRQVPLPKDVATTITDAIAGGDEHQADALRHSGDVSNPQTGAYHSQVTDTKNKEQEDRAFFYRQLDDGVRRVIRDPDAPVVLAGADSTAPHYRQASEHRALYPEWIHGNPQQVADDALHARALELLEPEWHRELNTLQEQYGSAYARQLASDNINQIVPAAAQGRVGILFVSPENRRFGKFDESSQMVDDRSDEEDLVDQAAVQTLLTGGQLVVVKPEDVPGKGEVAAIYRYLA